MSDWAAKRFWKQAEAVERDGAWTVTLDGRSVKTPAKTLLSVPTQAMAAAIAQEWDAQEEKIDPTRMPVTRAANAALDKVTPQRGEVAALIAAYGEDDLLCYRATHPAELIARQAATWDPMLAWARDELQVSLQTTQGVMHVGQPANSVATMQAIVDRQGPFSLTALHDLVSLSGSLILGLAAQAGTHDLDQLWADSILDDTWQSEQWGVDVEAAEALEIKRNAFLQAATFQQLVGLKSLDL